MPKHCLLLRNPHILVQNIDYYCENDIFFVKTSPIVVKSIYSWPKHCLLLRNRHILVQNIDYCYEIDIFFAKTLIIVTKSTYSSPKHCSLLRNRHILSHVRKQSGTMALQRPAPPLQVFQRPNCSDWCLNPEKKNMSKSLDSFSKSQTHNFQFINKTTFQNH